MTSGQDGQFNRCRGKKEILEKHKKYIYITQLSSKLFFFKKRKSADARNKDKTEETKSYIHIRALLFIPTWG